MNHELVLTFAKIAELTYENPKTAKSKFTSIGYDIVKFFDVDGAQAYLLKGDTHVLSFRGTQVTQLSDVVADIRIFKHKESTGGRVHVGFKTEVDKLWDLITNELQKIEGDLCVTGHSLGAAMATIAAGRLQNKVKTLITFGSPRVGNRKFVKSVQVEHFRVQNNNDDVTKVPPYFLGFKHHGTHVYLNYEGKVLKDKFWTIAFDLLWSRIKGWNDDKHFKGISDHFMSNYITKLSK